MTEPRYMNLPVKPDVYAKVKLIAEANGRGLGNQIEAWAEAELPGCGHDLEPVAIEYPGVTSILRRAYFCSICKRVYAGADIHWVQPMGAPMGKDLDARVIKEEPPVKPKRRKSAADPYGQPRGVK